MKGQPFFRRAVFAGRGIVAAIRHEASFRTHLLAVLATVAATAWVSPALYWWALIVVMIVGVLAAELMNTALEHTLDGLHRDRAEFVRIAKDCAAGGVAVFSLGAVLVFVLMLKDSGVFGG